MAQLIGPQIVELSKARDLFRESQLHETVSSLLRAVPTAGTSPQATSLTIGIAGTALGLRSHEMLGAVIAEARARAANDETINEGQSLATDVFAAWQEADASDEKHAAVLKFLDDFISKIGAYLAKVDSLPGLAGVLPLVMLIVAIISLKYQSESITTEDMEKLVASQQTHSIQANKILLEKIDELIETTRNLAASRIASMAPEIIYKTERSIPVHSDSRMISPPVGALHVGDLVSVKTFAKKWIEIEYFDQLLGRNVRGWVVKKYLKKV